MYKKALKTAERYVEQEIQKAAKRKDLESCVDLTGNGQAYSEALARMLVKAAENKSKKK